MGGGINQQLQKLLIKFAKSQSQQVAFLMHFIFNSTHCSGLMLKDIAAVEIFKIAEYSKKRNCFTIQLVNYLSMPSCKVLMQFNVLYKSFKNKYQRAGSYGKNIGRKLKSRNCYYLIIFLPQIGLSKKPCYLVWTLIATQVCMYLFSINTPWI